MSQRSGPSDRVVEGGLTIPVPRRHILSLATSLDAVNLMERAAFLPGP